MSRIIFSVSEAYFPAARGELLSAFPAAKIERLGPEVGCFQMDNIDIPDIAEICRQRPIVFVQHLVRESVRLPLSRVSNDIDLISETALGLLADCHTDPGLALHVWSSGASLPGYRLDELWRHVADCMHRSGFVVTRGGQEHILSVVATPRGVVLGINRRADALTDWPGGRVGLARDDSQVSRAEFKLEELFKIFSLPFPSDGIALDLGASPGGWTRILRRTGLTVWAIDPGDLDARVAADPGVHHVKTTAGHFLAETDLSFDLVVNDMRMVPALSCKVMLEAAHRLKPGGLAILTLKISPHDPRATVDRCLGILGRSYDILHARQLYHNRNEVTVVARRREPEAAVSAVRTVA